MKLKLTLLATTFSLFVNAQDIHFSQFFMSPLLQNPAMTGANYDLEATANYKDQWKSVASPYKTIAATYDMRFLHKQPKNGFWSGGMLLYSDKAGDANMGILQAGLSGAYHVFLNKYSTLGLGAQASFVQRSISYANLQWGSQYNGSQYVSTDPTGEPLNAAQTISFADAGAGIVWTYDKGEMYISAHNHIKTNLGFSMFHLTKPDYSFYSGDEKLNIKYVLHGNANIGIKNSAISFVPGFMYYKQGTAQELFFGTSFRYLLKEESKYTAFVKGAALSMGAYYRNKDAVALTMLIELSNYAIGFSYDVNTSDLKTASNSKGGFEISLRFVNPNPFLYKSQSRL